MHCTNGFKMQSAADFSANSMFNPFFKKNSKREKEGRKELKGYSA